MGPTVLHVVDSLDPGGAERVAVDLCNQLAARGVAVHLCATRRAGALEGDLEGVEFFCLGRRRRWDLRGVARFVREVRWRGVEVVHSHGRSTMQFVSLARLFGLGRVPHVFHDHAGAAVDVLPGPGLRWAVRLGVSFYVGADERLAERAVTTFGMAPERITVLRNALDLTRFVQARAVDVRTAFDLPHADVVIAMVANLHPVKNHRLAIEASSALPEGSRVGLLLIGATPEARSEYRRSLERLVDEAGFEGARFVAGRRDIPELLLGCDIGVLSSTAESGPLAVLEYMAAGLPFVATRVGQITRDVEGSGAGIVVDAGDLEAFREALSRLVGMSDDERSAIGALGRHMVEDQFSIEANVERLEQVYRGLAGTRSSSSER
jgi:glycosyltransferase involved in cell wall biosynthesis